MGWGRQGDQEGKEVGYIREVSGSDPPDPLRPPRPPKTYPAFLGFHAKYTGTPSSTMISPGHVVAVR